MPDTEDVKRFEEMAYQVAEEIDLKKDGYKVLCRRDQRDEGGRLYYQIQALRKDIVTGEMGYGYGGKAYLSPAQVLSELVKVAFGLFRAYEEHECRENFHWRGHRIFGPHIDVQALAQVAECYDVRPVLPKEPHFTQEEMEARARRVSAHIRQDHLPQMEVVDPNWQKNPVIAHEALHRRLEGSTVYDGGDPFCLWCSREGKPSPHDHESDDHDLLPAL